MNQINLQNRLAVSNGTVKNGQNNAMQPASQTTESPATAKKRLGLLAVLAVGVDAAASFLKTKMEKAAAVASQVGAAILKSKKAVSAAATAILGVVQPKSQKIAEKRFAKARLASIPILALMSSFFIASLNGRAGYRGYWAPKYDEQYYNRTTHVWINIPFTEKRIRTVNLSRNKDKMKSDFWSKYYKPDSIIIGQASETIYKNDGVTYERRELTTHYRSGAIATWGLYRDVNDRLQFFYSGNAGGLGLVFHTKVGGIRTNLKVSDTRESICHEKWGNYIWFRDASNDKADYTVELRTFFGARAFVGPTYLSSELDYHGVDGVCESSRVTYPGPAVKLTPCRPSNMGRIPFSNGYLEYSFWTQLESQSFSDDDDK